MRLPLREMLLTNQLSFGGLHVERRSVPQRILDCGYDADRLHYLAGLGDSLCLIARQNLENSLVRGSDSSYVAVRVVREFFRGFSRSRRGFADHLGLELVESRKDEGRPARSVFPA